MPLFAPVTSAVVCSLMGFACRGRGVVEHHGSLLSGKWIGCPGTIPDTISA